jgi:hypothetical protein
MDAQDAGGATTQGQQSSDQQPSILPSSSNNAFAKLKNMMKHEQNMVKKGT